jgi:D-aspartate ligase
MTLLDGTTCVVLGASATGLAVVRGLHRLGGVCRVVDESLGWAAHSRYCAKLFVGQQRLGQNSSSNDYLEAILSFKDSKSKPIIIGTSDRWLHFLIEHWECLSSHFTILHPDARTLKLCLDKARFYEWCGGQGIRVPKTLSTGAVTSSDPAISALKLPYIVRISDRGLQSPDFPKTLEIKTQTEFKQLLSTANLAGYLDRLLISESLLGRRLIQYSVPFCRNGENTLAYVAIKRRPPPEACAVGAYVVLDENSDVLELATNLATKLAYCGIGELEVLHDLDSKENFVIELNPRPWSQFNLQYVAGYDFLDHLLNQSRSGPSSVQSVGAGWLSLYDDLYEFRQVLRGDPSGKTKKIIQFATSLLQARAFALWSLKDPMPAFLNLNRILRTYWNRAKGV